MLILPPLSLYIHIPWCVQKCPYCDFNSHGVKAEIPHRRYLSALLVDLDNDIAHYQLASEREGEPRALSSIFIGGGTPSLLEPEIMAELLFEINKRLAFADDIEISMEANPSTVENARLKAFLQAGITRFSFGVQSFNDVQLLELGRIHNANHALEAIAAVKSLAPKSFNIDLMHGLPKQTVAQALADLTQAVELAPPHLSWYQLTIEPNTLFYSKPPKLPDDETLWDIFEQGHQILSMAGYQQYETSGYSLLGHQCQHNLNYWRYGDYLGIGCGAHGKISRESGQIYRTCKIKHPKGYLAQLATISPNFNADVQKINDQDRPFEFVMNRFRLLEPCPKQEFVDRTGLPLSAINKPMDEVLRLGYLTETLTHWQITDKGKLFLNDLLEPFLAEE